MRKIEELKMLNMAKQREKYPNVPAHAITPYNYTDKTANGLTRCIIDWIKFNGGQAERINTMGRVLDNRKLVKNIVGQQKMIGSTQYIPSTSTKGSSDISATIQGRSVKIEVKIGNDRQSEAQKKYQLNIEAAGGVYMIATSFENFINQLNQLNNGKQI